MASVRQIKSQIEKHGADKAAWMCFWRSPDGSQHSKSFGAGPVGLRKANKFATTVEAELHLGTYERKSDATWAKFYDEYVKTIVSQQAGAHAGTTLRSLKPFVRIAKPGRMRAIDSRMIAAFSATRSKERGRAAGSTLSPDSLHKELTYLRSALTVAKEWGYIVEMPAIRFPKRPERLRSWIGLEDFSAIYQACDCMTLPCLPNLKPGDWWRAFLVTLYMTGWRVSQVRAIRWEHVDLEAATILSPNDANKGKRDEFLPLHPVIRDHLLLIRGSFSELVFSAGDEAGIPMSKDRLLSRFRLIQQEAGIVPKFKRPGLWYAWHDFRRGFATINGANMDTFELQKLMQHKSLSTTQRYIAMAGRLDRPVSQLIVPDILRRDA
jgi:integrase